LIGDKRAKLLHASVEIDANRPMGESGPRGDFRSGHALDEAKDERFAISDWQKAYGFENLVSFGSAAATGGMRALLIAVKFLVEFGGRSRLAVKIGGPIAGDGREPTTEPRDVTERVETRKRLKENVLNEVFDRRVRNL
jgi:hypothetical protein